MIVVSVQLSTQQLTPTPLVNGFSSRFGISVIVVVHKRQFIASEPLDDCKAVHHCSHFTRAFLTTAQEGVVEALQPEQSETWAAMSMWLEVVSGFHLCTTSVDHQPQSRLIMVTSLWSDLLR
ncbi:hypothetical protein IAQ61_012003 [Plenodomus lingam]|uniref:uncharacterized protein n=1 Tax=Leptosphaeria maculans TaxID=5022 RepID=UPI00331686E6|nr:hypothetical protein IAQ61_012003 [Plenodomus lingam]